MSRAKLVVFLVAAALLSVAVTIVWSRASAARARLVMRDPETISSDPPLYLLAISLGRPAFASYCAACHGPHGEPDRRRGVPDLRDHDWLYGSGRVMEIERVVLYGIRAGNSKGWKLASMPAFARANPYALYRMDPLPPREIEDVTEFLYSLRHPDADATAAMRGKQVFEGQARGLCWDCHSGGAEGNSAIGAPNLRDDIQLYGDGSRASIRASIVYGRAGVCPAWVGKLSAVTIRSLAVYVQSLSQRPEESRE